MPKLKAYAGGCHCGRVRYETTTDPSQAIACNCSICAKHGLWLTFVPPQDFKLVLGSTTSPTISSTSTSSITCSVAHAGWGCSRAGSPRTARTDSINVRCLDGVDIAKLEPKPFDGRSL